MRKMSSADEHIVETSTGRQLARTAARRPEIVHGFVLAQVVCSPPEPKLSLLPAVQAQLQVYLTRRVMEMFGPTAGCKACAGRSDTLTSAEPGWKNV